MIKTIADWLPLLFCPHTYIRKGMSILKPTKLTFINGKPTLVSYDKIVRKDNDKAYNFHRNVEENDYVKFYHSTEWKHKRQEILERDYGLCQRCGMDAELVDHIIPSKDDWSDRLNNDNLQSLCRGCHKIKTKREWMKHHKGLERSHLITLNPVNVGFLGMTNQTFLRQIF